MKRLFKFETKAYFFNSNPNSNSTLTFIRENFKFKMGLQFLMPLIFLFAFFGQAHANKKLEDLLNKISQERSMESELWQQREAEFMAEKNKQQSLLKKAQSELVALQNEGQRLSRIYDANEVSLQKLEEKKNLVMGAFGELYGTVRQSAGDFNTLLLNSATSAQYPQRFKAIQDLAQTKRLPEYSELENFWFLLQQEMTLQGQTPSYQAKVTDAKGLSLEQTVTRIGAFNNYVDNSYVTFDSKSKSIEFYPRQPARRFTKNLDDFAKLGTGMGLVSIDPSKGALLETLIQAPTLMERFHQGGLVGYIIFILLVIGFIVAGERLVFYRIQEKEMKLQLADPTKIRPGNPLAALIEVFNKYKNVEGSEVIGLKLSEVVLHEKPKLSRGLNTIKTFAGVAPLLGLLGTVTGMILTFQSITMFGSGDPKLMAGGISQALVTTVLGLVCAIPLLVVYNYVNGRYQNIMIFLNEQLAGMLAEIEEKQASK